MSGSRARKTPVSIGGSRNTKPSRSAARIGNRHHDHAIFKDKSTCSAATQSVMESMVKGDEGTCVLMHPNTVRHFYNALGNGPEYENPWSKGGTPFASVKTVSVVAGNQSPTAYGQMLINPGGLGFSGTNSTLVSTATWAGTGVAVNTTTGITYTDIALNEPYAQQGLNGAVRQIFAITGLTVRMKVNSQAVNARGGRLYAGYLHGSLAGSIGSTLQSYHSFSVWDLANLDPDDNPVYVHIPQGVPNLGITGDSLIFSGPQQPHILFWMEGPTAAVGGVQFDFEVKMSGMYYGNSIPIMTDIHWDDKAWNCARSCLVEALPPSRVIGMKAKGRIVQRAYKNADEYSLRTTPRSLLATAYDTMSTMWKGGAGSLIRDVAKAMLL